MTKTIEVIGLPMDLGADTRGVDMGPSALRIAGLHTCIKGLGYELVDQGNLPVRISSQLEIENPSMKYVEEILRSSQAFAFATEQVLDRGNFPLLIGGDHSMAIGSLAGIAAHCRHHDKRLGVIWVDAHTDMNTPATSPSGNVHGMPLAASLGHGEDILTEFYGFSPKLDAKHVHLIGIRSIDKGEIETTRQTGIHVYTMTDVDRMGIYQVAEAVINQLKGEIDHLHISFDLDSLDPEVAPGVGTPVPGGLTYREAHTLMETFAESGLVHSFEITEVNPILDLKNKTAKIALSLMQSALGKRIF